MVAYGCSHRDGAHQLGVIEKVVLCLSYACFDLISCGDYERDIRLILYRRFKRIVPAERVMLEDFVELSVARTAYLRVGNKENIIFFVAAGVERICFRPFAILGNSVIVSGVALEIFDGHIVLPSVEGGVRAFDF